MNIMLDIRFMIAHLLLLCLLISCNCGISENDISSVSYRAGSHRKNCSYAWYTDHEKAEIACLHVTSDNFKYVHHILQTIGEKNNVHKIIIEGVGIPQSIFGSKLLDRFLMTNPWLVLKKEVYNHVRIAEKEPRVHEAVLTRFNIEFEPRLRKLAAVQYPPSQEICDQTSLYVGRMIGDGWGAQLLFAILRQHSPYSVFTTWHTLNNQIDESMQMCRAEDCVHTLTPHVALGMRISTSDQLFS